MIWIEVTDSHLKRGGAKQGESCDRVGDLEKYQPS